MVRKGGGGQANNLIMSQQPGAFWDTGLYPWVWLCLRESGMKISFVAAHTKPAVNATVSLQRGERAEGSGVRQKSLYLAFIQGIIVIRKQLK